MVTGSFREEQTEVVFAYFPAWEMFFSLHVLANPAHHDTRRQWVRRMEERCGDLLGEIRGLNEETDGWVLLIDSDFWQNVREWEIPEVLAAWEDMHIYRWNASFRGGREPMSMETRNRIRTVVRRYYEEIYRKQEERLRPILLQKLLREQRRCQRMGIWRWCRELHPRLCVEPGHLVYRKNRDYSYPRAEIRRIFVTFSTFVSPHLWLYEREGEHQLVCGLEMESGAAEIPRDFLALFHVLGDGSRLRILGQLMKGPMSGRELARTLEISEAAVSKHLKAMREVGLVTKRRQGNSQMYELLPDAIDFLPYRFYEALTAYIKGSEERRT